MKIDDSENMNTSQWETYSSLLQPPPPPPQIEMTDKCKAEAGGAICQANSIYKDNSLCGGESHDTCEKQSVQDKQFEIFGSILNVLV